MPTKLEDCAGVYLRGGHSALKLGLLMRLLVGVGTPRSLQGRAMGFIDALSASVVPGNQRISRGIMRV